MPEPTTTIDQGSAVGKGQMRPSKEHTKINFRKINAAEFDRLKTAMTIDYIFGRGTSKSIDFSKVVFHHSRKTGRIRQLEDRESGKVLFTFRSNGTIAPSIDGASMLMSGMRKRNSPRWVVTVMEGVSDFVSSGKTVFCKHVANCSDKLRAGEDVVIVDEERKILAVGRAVLDGSAVKEFKRGQAIKVREGVRK